MHAYSTSDIRLPEPISPPTEWPATAAERALVEAICNAREHDLLAQISRAIAMGACLNDPDHYYRNALVVAARNNRVDAIWPLVMRGADAPPYPPGGVDLLMEACRHGQIPLAKALVELVGITADYEDDQGRSALHHAALSGSVDMVRQVIAFGADLDGAAMTIEEGEVRRIFGYAHPLVGKAVTPLMIAIAIGSEAMALELLNAGADPNAGGCAPLILAACHDRRLVFSQLLQHGAKLSSCVYGPDTVGLDACIYARMPVAYLGQLIDTHDFTKDDGSVRSPLGSAVSIRAIDTVALLLAYGAPVSQHHADSRLFTLWEQALPPNQMSSEVLDLLTARSPVVIQAGDINAAERLFGLISRTIDAPESLASLGIFTSLLCTSARGLKQMVNQSYLTERQRMLEVAWILSRMLPRLPPPTAVVNEAQLLPHEQWLHRTSMKRYQQCAQLRETADAVILECIKQLEANIKPHFIPLGGNGWPAEMPPSLFVASQLATQAGLPDAIITLITHVRKTAGELASQWAAGIQDRDARLRFQTTLIRNLLQKALEENEIEHTPLDDFFLGMIQSAIPINTHPLSQFCCDPVAWLLPFAVRHNHFASVTVAAYELQMELGLPGTACDAIIQIWKAHAGAPQTAHQVPDRLKRELAIGLPKILFTNSIKHVLAQSSQAKLLSWRAQTLSTQSSASFYQQHATEPESPEGPPRKKPRY